MKIGFIGQGFIGKTYADFMEECGFDVVRYSLEPEYAPNREKIAECDIVFVAVPTPTTPEGFDSSLVEGVLPLVRSGATAVIKSTIQPGTTEALQEKFPELFVIHSPEFLTESKAAEDVRHPVRSIAGIPKDTPEFRRRAEEMLALYAPAPYKAVMSAREAEMVKYAANCILYTKVVFVNLLYDLAKVNSCSWETIRDALKADPRIGSTHLDPVHKSGPKAQSVGRGAGGHCFIKDFETLRRLYKDLNDTLGSDVLDALVAKNNALLKESGKDLDLLKGVYGI